MSFGGCAGTVDRITDRAANAAGRAVDRQVDRRTDRAVDSAIDGMFDAGAAVARCVFTDQACIDRAQRSGENVVLTDRDGTPVDRSGRPVSDANAEDAVFRAASISNANANYDFAPGERTLFAEDFRSDRVGDFPRSLYYLSGTAEVVDFQGQRFLRYTSGGAFEIRLGERLPTTFTIEMDVQTMSNSNVSLYTTPRVNDNDLNPFSGYDGDYLNVGNWRGSGLWGERNPKSVVRIPNDEIVHIEITVDDAYVKMYADRARIANVPRADLRRHNAITVTVDARDNDRLLYIGNIRVAGGGNDLYGALQTDGRVVTEGITFDTASATLRPESFAVVQEIAAMMQAHPELRVRVEGHTDSEGDPASNLRLSEQRARAVRTMLVGLGVAESRLEAVGHGQTRPVASNDTAAGRQQNRRVELVRL